MSASPSNQVTPQRILGMGWGFAPPIVIDAAIENGVFDALDRSPMNIPELVKATGASERGISALAGALTGFELLVKEADGKYRLTPEAAAFLVKGKPGFHGGLFHHFRTGIIPGWLGLSEVVRSGRPDDRVDDPETGQVFFKQLVDALFSMNYPAARMLALSLEESRSADRKNEKIKVLDIAAGSGVWGIAQAEVSPQVEVTALDLEPVLEVTRRTAEKCGVGERFSYQAGDLRTTDLGTGYSLVLLGHILHSEGAEQSRALLKRIFSALRPGGTLAIAEFLVNAERTGPPQGLIFAVNMLVHTTDGNTFSPEEISVWLKDAGFEKIRSLDVPAPSPLLLAEKPLQ